MSPAEISAPEQLLAALNPEQREAAAAITGPVRILAGAGTGKTRTITHRIVAQVLSGAFQPSQILAVTFTDRAAGEMRGRIAALAAEAGASQADGRPLSIRALTFHAAAWAQVRHFWPHLDDGPLPEVLGTKTGILFPHARRHNVDVGDLASEVERAASAAAIAKATPRDGHALAPPDHEALATRLAGLPGDALLEADALASVIVSYAREKQERGVIDYEDMLRLSRWLLDVEAAATTIRDRYRAFTVDEFQDTNALQWDLLRAWAGDRDDVCVVGDPAQTIFSFTGADSRFLQRFTSTFPDATTVALSRSYRSTPQVLSLANAVLGRRAKPLRAVDPTAGPQAVLRESADDDAEQDLVVDAITTLRAGGVPAREIAICYRINAQAGPWEDALRAAGIPTVVAGGGSFYQREEVRQAVRMLAQAAAAPPAPRGSEPPPVIDAPVVNADPADQIDQILRDGLKWRGDKPPTGARAKERWEHIRALRDEAAALVADGADLPGAVEDLQARAGAGLHHQTDAVTLMSMHKAKGTEFDAVFLVGLEEGLVPISYAKDDEDVEEERRLLYVGATRARRYLWLTWATQRPGRSGKLVKRRPSRFLYGLGPGAPTPGSGKKKGQKAPVPADVDPELAERLRAWRRERSSDDGVPAFVVFNDATLHELAARKPTSRKTLLQVKGFGPAKAERYGPEILAVIDGG